MPRTTAQTKANEIAAAVSQVDDLGVQDFLEGFALALTEGAVDAIASMWELPAIVVADDYVEAVQDKSDIADLFEGAREHYNSAGVTDTRPEIVRLDEITDSIVVVRVRWPWLDDDGHEVGAECSTYVLRHNAIGEWKIRSVIMHGAEALN